MHLKLIAVLLPAVCTGFLAPPCVRVAVPRAHALERPTTSFLRGAPSHYGSRRLAANAASTSAEAAPRPQPLLQAYRAAAVVLAAQASAPVLLIASPPSSLDLLRWVETYNDGP